MTPRGPLGDLEALATAAEALLVKARREACNGQPLDAVELAIAGYRRSLDAVALATAAARMAQFVRRRGPLHLSLACAQVEQALARVQHR